jgi:hypothetical protein
MRDATWATAALVLGGFAALPVALAPSARASEPIGVVAVAPPPGPSPVLVELTGILRQRIAERQTGTLDAAQLRDRSGAPRTAPLAELERTFDQARLAYLEGDVSRSLRTLRPIAAELEKLPGGADVQALWTKVLMRIARTELELGRREEARATLEALLRGAPDLAVDPSLVPARLAEEIERERAALQALPAGTLVVGASAAGARVYVNGRLAGAAPVRLDLPRGRCRVAGTTETSQVGPFDVEIREGSREVLLDFSIPEALRPWAGQGVAARTDERSRTLLAVGHQLQLDRVVGVAEDGESQFVLASVYDVRRGRLEREARLRLVDRAFPAGGDTALADFIVNGRTDSPLVLVPGPPVSAPARAQETGGSPVASQALRWSPVVTGLATVAFTAAALVQVRTAQESYDRATQFRGVNGLGTFHDVATYNGYVSTGDAAKGRAGGYWTGAALCAAATGILGYVSYRRTGEVGPVRF